MPFPITLAVVLYNSLYCRIVKITKKLALVYLLCKRRCFKTANIKNFISKFNVQMLAITFISLSGMSTLTSVLMICDKILIFAVLKQRLLQRRKTEN